MPPDEIGVMVVKAVPIDRDGATSLIKAFIEWCQREEIDPSDSPYLAAGRAFDLAKKFTDRYATLNSGEEIKRQ